MVTMMRTVTMINETVTVVITIIIIMIHRFLVNRAVNIVSYGLCCLVLVISICHLGYITVDFDV